MPQLIVTSSSRGAGKTGVAAAIARTLAYEGTPVRLARVGGADDPGAKEDAAYFGRCEFAPGSWEEPVAEPPAAGEGEFVVCEADGSEAAGRIVVARRSLPEPPALTGAKAVVVTAVPAFELASVPREMDGVPVFAVPEDRTLAGFTLRDVQELIPGELLVAGDVPEDTTCDHLVIAPIGSDAGQPYFRRFESMAVVARFDRTDMHLAALAADPNFLILTGGRHPSGYTIDAAEARGVPVYLVPTDTESTVLLLEDVFGRSRFRGERKLERMAALLAEAGLFETVRPAALAG